VQDVTIEESSFKWEKYRNTLVIFLGEMLMVLCTSMISYAKSGTARTGDRLNGFEKGKTQQFNSGGVVK